MTRLMPLFVLSALFGFSIAAGAASTSASDRAEWNTPQKPFRIFGDTYYVGTHGLSSLLIDTGHGLVLIDGDLPESAPLIEANVRALGFHVRDLKWILNSHAHFDHAGGIAQLQRDSGARVVASRAGAREMELGGDDPDDPQHGIISGYTPPRDVQMVRDGETLKLGDAALTAHYMPGHTTGDTAWTWRTCESAHCLNIAYVDSTTPIGAPGFRFSDDARHPRRVEDFRHSIAMIATLPCDILLTPHPGASDFWNRVQRHDAGTRPDPLVDPGACRAYSARASAQLDARLRQERQGAAAAQ